MPYTAEERRRNSQGELRDAHGHFISQKPKGEPEAPTTSQTTPPSPAQPQTQTVKVQVETPRQQNSNSDQLVSLNIKNPLTYVTRSLTKAINKPMTIKIPPLFAIPIIVSFAGIIPFSFFGLGKAVQKQEIAALPTPTPIVIIQPTPTPAPVLVSRMGVIKATYQVQYLLSPSPIPSIAPTDTQSSLSATPIEIPPTPTPVPNRFVLVKGEDITFLVAPLDINFFYYLNRKVLITGLYDKAKDTLNISKSSDIEVLP